MIEIEITIPKTSRLRYLYEIRFLLLTVLLLGAILWLHYYGTSFNLTLFVRVFSGIFFGSLIYLLLGIVIGSIVKTYIPLENLMLRLVEHERTGVVLGSLMGVLVPVCTCGLLPLFATLVEQKMPRKACRLCSHRCSLWNPYSCYSDCVYDSLRNNWGSVLGHLT